MKNLRIYTLFCILVLAGGLPATLPARAAENGRKANAPVFVEVRLKSRATLSRLKPGDVLQGETAGNVFSGYRLMIPMGSRVSLRVSGRVRRRKETGLQWPWPIRHFRSKYNDLPTFDQITVSLSGTGTTRLPVSFVTAYDKIQVTGQSPNGRKSGKGSLSAGAKHQHKEKKVRGSTLELVVETCPHHVAPIPLTFATRSLSEVSSQPGIETLAAGIETKLALLGRLSASKSRAGDPFKAVLLEPLRLSSGEILPQGSLFEGHVRKSIAPRWLSRPGSLYLTFNRLVLPTGGGLPIAASVVGTETDRQSQMKVDSEGNLHGSRPGKKQLLADLGFGFAVSKVADDSFQLVAEALVSTATDASTAGTARLVGMALGGIFFIKRHGRDVVLPPYTIIDIRFDRSPSLPATAAQWQGMQ